MPHRMIDTLYLKKIKYLIIILAFSGCNPSYHNKELYNIKIGEKFEAYVAENSCCIYSWANKATAKKTRMVRERLAENNVSNYRIICGE